MVAFLRRPRVLFFYVSTNVVLLLLFYITLLSSARYYGHFFLLLLACFWIAHHEPIDRSRRQALAWLGDRVGSALLTGVLLQQSGTLPSHWHAGVNASSFVRTSDFENIGEQPVHIMFVEVKGARAQAQDLGSYLREQQGKD